METRSPLGGLPDYGRPGFAEQYGASRPHTPSALVDLLCLYARVERPRLVVDLGCGTGLSTAIWPDRADGVIGIEREPAMLALARQSQTAPNVELRGGVAQDTGLPAASADIVTCVQSFHWMEPEATLREVARILRPGGVFAAVDYDMPAVGWEVEVADLRFIETARRLRREHGLGMLQVKSVDQRKWPKDSHLDSLRGSGHFCYVREALLHGVEQISAERFLQTALELAGAPWGVLEALHARGVTDEQLGLTQFRAVADRLVGANGHWFVGYRIGLGIRA